MSSFQTLGERRTSADDVFDHLYTEIVSMNLLPGKKLSEVDTARQFAVSRQPVREAFIRLDNLGLLQIRPQKATVVRKFSRSGIANARLVRTAVEIEIIRRACKMENPGDNKAIKANLKNQQEAMSAKDTDTFHALDYDFHRLLCTVAKCDFAFQTISDCKAQLDRLCMLSLAQDTEMAVLFEDHQTIYTALCDGDEEMAHQAVRRHFGRLDGTVASIESGHLDYFED